MLSKCHIYSLQADRLLLKRKILSFHPDVNAFSPGTIKLTVGSIKIVEKS